MFDCRDRIFHDGCGIFLLLVAEEHGLETSG